MALKAKYQGREQSKSRDEHTYREVWYGTEAEVDAKIATLVIGVLDAVKGYLHSWSKSQASPAIWELEINYRVTFAQDTESNEEADDPATETTSNKTYSLSVRNIQMPVENHASYKACWNHYLVGLGSASLPAWWSTATNTLLSPTNRQRYMWVDSISEIPVDMTAEGQYWVILAMPTKPGVSCYDMACFVVTESARYKTSSAAGNHVSKNINTVRVPPHTFGITGGEWKCDEGAVSHDGKRWIATQTWTHAAHWDTDIYPHPSSANA